MLLRCWCLDDVNPICGPNSRSCRECYIQNIGEWYYPLVKCEANIHHVKTIINHVKTIHNGDLENQL